MMYIKHKIISDKQSLNCPQTSEHNPFSNKVWEISAPLQRGSSYRAWITSFGQELKEKANIKAFTELVAHLLRSRGITEIESAKRIFSKDYSLLQPPWIIHNMEKAVDRFLQAIQNKEVIGIHGDHDVDGMTSTAILYRLCKIFGLTVDYRVPKKSDGHNLQKKYIKELADKGTKLLLVIDTGTKDLEAISYAKSLGMDVIVLDHHELGESLPEDAILVNPHTVKEQKFFYKGLCGAGLGYIFARGVHEKKGNPLTLETDEYLPIAGIGTVGDVMSLAIGEDLANQIIVNNALAILNQQISRIKDPTIQALAKCLQDNTKANPPYTAETIAYQIAPMLAAISRMKEDSARGVALLINQDRVAAIKEWRQFILLNEARKQLSNDAFLEVERIILEKPSLLQNNILILVSDEWGKGILSPLAAKTAERYGRPTFLIIRINRADQPIVVNCSARTAGKVNIYEITEQLDKDGLFTSFGGHPFALGFNTTEVNLPMVIQRLKEIAKERISAQDLVPTIPIETELSPKHISLEMAKAVAVLEPFGHNNQKPVFLARNFTIKRIEAMGNNKHLKFEFQSSDGIVFKAVWFNMGHLIEKLQIEQTVDIAFNLAINTFRGRESLDLQIVDIKLH